MNNKSKENTAAVGAMYHFGTFRPSDRRELLSLVSSIEGEDVFVEALQIFLEKWDQSDWLEHYNIERVAKWCAKNLSDKVFLRLADTFEVTRKVRTRGQDSFGVFLKQSDFLGRQSVTSANVKAAVAG